MINSINSIGLPPIPQDFGAAKVAGPGAAAELGRLNGGSQVLQGAEKNFASVLEKAVDAVDQKMRTSGEEQVKLMTGETNNIHQAMIAMQESGVAFSLMVEVRNKLVESYQELMRMQI